jgi:single-stranded-DNA-specific exonuclease
MRELISGDSARKLVLRGETEVLLIHHNDTDGLSAAAILVKALERENLKVRRVCLEKPYPEVVTELFEQSTDNNTLVIMVDFGSGMLDLISRLSIKEKRRCIVLDHHAIFGELAPEVHLINPLSMGLQGEDCSASAVAYFFSQSLNKWNEDLASLGVLGALGDGFISHDKLIGLNQNVMTTALKSSQLNEEFVYRDSQGEYFWRDVVSAVDALGSVGYFRGGPDIAVKGLAFNDLYGMIELSKPFVAQLNQVFQKVASEIQINQAAHISWFNLDNRFEGFGVKTVGLFCQYLRDNNLINPDKFIAGFQPIPRMLPGLPILAPLQTKVSMRVPENLKKRIEDKSQLDLTAILPVATKKLGGFVDACHPLAASTTIPLGEEEALVGIMEKLLG